MWQWANFLERTLSTRKTVVYLNFDESSCRLWTPPRRGLLTRTTCRKLQQGREKRQAALLSQRRTAFSLLAFLADDVLVQKALPQFICVNSHTLSAADATWLAAATRESNIIVQRRKSAWAKSSDVAEILRHVGRALRPWRETHTFILALDACSTHWTQSVARAAAESNLALLFVPPHTTSFLQPLDVHVFQHVKRAARAGLEDLYLKQESGYIASRAIVHMWALVVRETLDSRCWKFAFRSCGFGQGQSCIGERCKARTGIGAPPSVGHELPSLSLLHVCTTSRTKLPIGWWFHLPVQVDRASREAAAFSASPLFDSAPCLSEPLHASVTTAPPAASADTGCLTARTRDATATSRTTVPRARLLFPSRKRR